MSDLIWKLKRFVRKAFPIALIGAFLYGGYTLYRQGAFRHGVSHAVTSVLRRLPYFGSRFRHYSGGRSSYAYSGRGSRRRVMRRSRRRGRRR